MAQIGLKIAAGLVLAVIAMILVLFGVGALCFALAMALTPFLGLAGGWAVAGAIFAVPPVLWALITLASRPKPPPKPAAPAPGSLWLTLFAAIARETPWIAIAGAGLVAAAEIFLLRGRKRP